MFDRLAAAALLTVAFAASAAEPGDNIHLTPGPVASPQVFDALLEKDRQLFDAVFTSCDADALGPMVTHDFEFFHDKGGQTADSGAAFVSSIRAMCERRKTGEDFIARRELDRDSLTVHLLGSFGAMQMGSHRFYAIVPGQPDRLTETGKFIDVWKEVDGDWKLARVISYDHRLADAH